MSFEDGLLIGLFSGMVLTCAAFIVLIILCGSYMRRNRFMCGEGNPK